MDARARSERIDDEMLVIFLRIIEDGRALSWPDLDEDIGIEPLLRST